jgi:hypothetical protein
VSTLSGLREALRSEVGDLASLSKERRFQNEQLNAALFSAIQRHNRALTWGTLPPEEEQLVLLLAKARLATDKALEYSLDPKITSGQSLSRGKVENADMLLRIARRLEEDYRDHRAMLFSSYSDSGDIVIGTLVREDRFIGAKVPLALAAPPKRPTLRVAEYLHNPATGSGMLRVVWDHPSEDDLAYVRLHVSDSPVFDYTAPAISTFYDMSFPQLRGEILYSFPRTGIWYLQLDAYNWNLLHTLSEVYSFSVENYVDLTADVYVVAP